jgi:hypothetical protein
MYLGQGHGLQLWKGLWDQLVVNLGIVAHRPRKCFLRLGL